VKDKKSKLTIKGRVLWIKDSPPFKIDISPFEFFPCALEMPIGREDVVKDATLTLTYGVVIEKKLLFFPPHPLVGIGIIHVFR